MRIKSLLQNFSVAVFSGLAVFLVMEIVLRTTHLFDARVSYSKPDSLLAYRYVPHAEYYFHKENPKVITGRINNHGWRDKDWNIEKPKETIRIAVLGDSFVEAFQVEQESTFVKILERELSTRLNTKSIDVMNFGRSGFTQTDELLVLESDVLKFSPDVVVVCVLPANDIEDVRKETAPDRLRPFFVYNKETTGLTLDTSFRYTEEFQAKIFVDMFKRNSALLSLVAERYTSYKIAKGIKEKSAAAMAKAEKIPGFMSLCSANPDSEQSKSYDLNKILIERISTICRTADAEILLMCFPTDAYLPEREKEYLRTDSTFQQNYFDDDLQRLSSSLRIHYLGLQRMFRQEYDRNRRPLHWAHLNYEGHRVTARALSNILHPLLERKHSVQ